MTAEFISQLRRYAEEAVNAARADLEVNLRRHTSQGPMVLDVALPGAAYFSVAAGGMADVLHFLRRFVQVDRFVGASGGACSLFLILANDAHSELLLFFLESERRTSLFNQAEPVCARMRKS
ncbi:unnamed protein product [Effrenium voratum]|nr:unnamed protein product [Effrenium voratum]